MVMKLASALLLILSLGLSVRAQTQTNVFTQTLNTALLDGNPNGTNTSIEVENVAGLIIDVSLSLQVTGGFTGDLYAYLSNGTNGGFAVLLNRVGSTESNPFGYEDEGFSIVLSDLATLDIHTYATGGASGLIVGTWQPDGRNIDPQFAIDTDPRTAMLSSFTNQPANGTWTLFIADMGAGGGQSTLVSWGITLTTQSPVPEPTTGSLLILGVVLFGTVLARRKSR